MEELLEAVFPGGPLLVVGVVLGAAFGGRLRPLAKGAVKASLVVTDRVQGAVGEAMERTQDLIAEARAERGQVSAPAPAPSTPRRTTTTKTTS